MIIAFCSPVMYSGKSTAAQRLVERHGFRLLKFAAPLKDMTAGYGWTSTHPLARGQFHLAEGETTPTPPEYTDVLAAFAASKAKPTPAQAVSTAPAIEAAPAVEPPPPANPPVEAAEGSSNP